MSFLSIVICKYNQKLFNRCINSIESTLTVNYEIVVIDNSKNSYNIFSAYNEGINKSSGDIVCFVHEDVIFHDNNWNKKVSEYFKKDKDLGMLGVVGGSSYHKFAWSWNQTYFKNDFLNSLYNPLNLTLKHFSEGLNSNSKQVLIVDGLWFCVRKDLFKKHNIRFDDRLYDGFHRYDFDISMQIAQIAKIVVVNNIKLEHTSSGNRNIDWMKANIIFQNKWKNLLPCKINPGYIGINKLKKGKKDLLALYRFIFLMKNYKFSKKQINSVIRKHFFLSNFNYQIQIKLVIIYILGIKTYSYLKHKLSLLIKF